MASDCLKEVTAMGMISPDSVLDYTTKQMLPGLPPDTLQVKVNGIYCLIQKFLMIEGWSKTQESSTKEALYTWIMKTFSC